jgi:hypothetical protein
MDGHGYAGFFQHYTISVKDHKGGLYDEMVCIDLYQFSRQ